jgi:hypothetical protein
MCFNDQKIYLNLHAALQTAIRGQASLDYRARRGTYGHGAYSDIDWQATGRQAMCKVTITRRHWVSKHSSAFCGTSKMMHRSGQRATDLCPHCLHEVVDATHVLQCQDPCALQVWKQSIANLEVWLKKQRTEPGIL